MAVNHKVIGSNPVGSVIILLLFRKIVIIIAFYLLFLFPLYRPMNIIGATGNILFGVDKILLGVILGTFFFIISILADLKLKKLNNGKVIINYQKVFIPIIILLIASFDIHMLLKLI